MKSLPKPKWDSGAMTREDLSTIHQARTFFQQKEKKRDLHQAQDIIYNFLLDIVKHWHPEAVLEEFKYLFVYQVGSNNPKALQALYDIVFENNELEFRHTLKRVCYILINNWDANRKHQYIQELIQIFDDSKMSQDTLSPTLDRLRVWVFNFVRSKDYEELKLFAARYDDRENWSHRYASYLLVPQYINLNNPVEQREAARALSKRLKDKFKFDLAMYTAHSQSTVPTARQVKNPTGLGDEVLRLIKSIVVKRGPFGYANLANIFIQQTQELNYELFKKSLIKYLIFSVASQECLTVLQKNMTEKLESLYGDYHEETITDSLFLRTCNRVIEYLVSENDRSPSQLFVLLLTQGSPLTLVIILLKLILISPNSRAHLESCIANVIRYYEKYSTEECQWVITFLELFNITFAIYAENVEYNIVQMQQTENNGKNSALDLDTYRIFSQLKQDKDSDGDTQSQSEI